MPHCLRGNPFFCEAKGEGEAKDRHGRALQDVTITWNDQ